MTVTEDREASREGGQDRDKLRGRVSLGCHLAAPVQREGHDRTGLPFAVRQGGQARRAHHLYLSIGVDRLPAVGRVLVGHQEQGMVGGVQPSGIAGMGS